MREPDPSSAAAAPGPEPSELEALLGEGDTQVVIDALLLLREDKIQAMRSVRADRPPTGTRPFEARDFGIPQIDALLKRLGTAPAEESPAPPLLADIQVRVNSEGALRNQRYAFSNRYTLVSELLQNARRAGATLIEVSHDEQAGILRVRDNGRGIDDFQKLLTFNESGWDRAIQHQELPFGVGFSKCLYAAARCVVSSNGHRVDFQTAAALARSLIPVRRYVPADDPQTGTAIELHGVVLPDLHRRIGAMCRGFPMAIEFNGASLSRPDALPASGYHETPVGRMRLAGAHDGKITTFTRFYLQGFCVHRDPQYHSTDDDSNVVHLDPTRFRARLPDRDVLIDQDEQIKLVNEEISRLWRRILQERKSALSTGSFVETFFPAMRQWGHVDLLDDVPLLPRTLCDEITAYPIQEPGSSCSFLEMVDAAPTREDIESGRIRLVSLDGPCDTSMARWMLAWKLHLVVFSIHVLKSTQWVHQHVRDLENEETSVQPVGETHRTLLEGAWLYTDTVLCERVRIQIGGDVVELEDDGLFHADTLFIPAGENTGCAAQQASSFFDSCDRFREDEQEADVEALAQLIHRLRAVDPLATLRSMLEQLKLEKYPSMQGRVFRLSVGATAADHVLDQLE